MLTSFLQAHKIPVNIYSNLFIKTSTPSIIEFNLHAYRNSSSCISNIIILNHSVTFNEAHDITDCVDFNEKIEMRYFPYHSADFKLHRNNQITRLWKV